MEYKTAKSLCVNTPLLILGVSSIIYTDSVKAGGWIVLYLSCAVGLGLVIGGLVWFLFRPLYCYRYIGRDKYTPGKLTSVWEFSSNIKLSKRMTLDQLINEIKLYVDRSYHSMALDDDELLDFCRAAVLLRYIKLVNDDVTDPAIEQFINQHHTTIQVLDFYKGA